MFEFPPAKAMRAIYGIPWSTTYTTVPDEYKALHQACGVLDLRQMVWLEVSGEDASTFLQGMVSQDVLGIPLGGALPSWLLDERGKILGFFPIFRQALNSFFIQLPPSLVGPTQQRLERFILMEKVSLTLHRQSQCFSLQGLTAPETASKLLDRFPKVQGFSHDRCGLGGVDLLVPPGHPSLASWAVPIGLNSLEVARVETFFPFFGTDIQLGGHPLSFGLQLGISSQKGCYVGQETIAKTRDRGRPPLIFAQLRAPKTLAVTPKSKDLFWKSRKVGKLTTVASSPKFGCVMALALLKTSMVPQQSFQDETGVPWTLVQCSKFKR